MHFPELKRQLAKNFYALGFAVLVCLSLHAQDISIYFEKIRNNEAELTAFFSQMPKGGDLHNHLSGAIYAETYINYVVKNDYYINTDNLLVSKKPIPASKDWVRFSKLDADGTLDEYLEKLIQKWSVKDYNYVSYPSDKQFFETFGRFDEASDSTREEGLLEVKNRAKAEHVDYLEVMVGINGEKSIKLPSLPLDQSLEKAQTNKDEALTFRILDTIFDAIISQVKPVALQNNARICSPHRRLAIDDDAFTMRYQFSFSRIAPPSSVFRKMLLAFQAVASDTSSLMVGVNIVAPENNDISMRDYWLHMEMFRYCHQKLPGVKYSLHAGELALGMVKPEQLTWHINAAVRVAGANRIGHGVDLPYEFDPYGLLTYMAANKIAVELNLFSNQFILKVQGDRHPITLYKRFGVPIVISTDDAGVLRSNLIDQYVMLASRYKNISYQDIKGFVYNSITYSFIKEPVLKQQLKTRLDNEFSQFEHTVLTTGNTGQP